MKKSLFLKSVEDLHPGIHLPNNETVVVGKSNLCITDRRCSK